MTLIIFLLDSGGQVSEFSRKIWLYVLAFKPNFPHQSQMKIQLYYNFQTNPAEQMLLHFYKWKIQCFGEIRLLRQILTTGIGHARSWIHVCLNSVLVSFAYSLWETNLE